MTFINSGHEIDGRITPIRRPSSAGGGNFNNAPIVLRDQTLTLTGFNSSFHFVNFTNILKELIARTSAAGGDPVPTLPLQWHTDTPAPGGDFSVRLIASLGPDGYNFIPAPVGTWIQCSGSASWFLNPVGGVGVEENEGVFEMATTADVTTILARRNIILRHVGT